MVINLYYATQDMIEGMEISPQTLIQPIPPAHSPTSTPLAELTIHHTYWGVGKALRIRGLRCYYQLPTKRVQPRTSSLTPLALSSLTYKMTLVLGPRSLWIIWAEKWNDSVPDNLPVPQVRLSIVWSHSPWMLITTQPATSIAPGSVWPKGFP